MVAVYNGNRTRMLCVLAYLKLRYKAESYCSFKEYFATLKPGRAYRLEDDGFVIFINRVS